MPKNDKKNLVTGKEGMVKHAPSPAMNEKAKAKFQERLDEPRVGPAGFERGISDKGVERIMNRPDQKEKKNKD